MVVLCALPWALLLDTIQFEVIADKDLMRLFGLIIYALSMPIALVAGDMYIKGTFDLDGDGLSEALLFSTSQIRYVEIQLDGSHETLWELSSNTYAIADVLFIDIDKDEKNELIVLADYYPENRQENNWLWIYTWDGTGFINAPVDMEDGNVFHPNHGDFEPDMEKVSVTVGSPVRSVKLLKISKIGPGYSVSSKDIDLPEMLHNGIGHIFSNFIRIENIPHMMISSPEEGLLKTSLVRLEEEPVIIANAILELYNARKLLGPAIQKTDFDGDHRDELQLPFSNGSILTLSYSDTVISLEPSKFNDEGLFTLNEDADETSINLALLARVEAGLFDQIDLVDDTILDSVSVPIIPDDTLSLGDTLIYKAAADTASGFYSFKWLSPPPNRAYFNPYSGEIRWAPSREQLGIHIFEYFTETKLKDKLISEDDLLGDSHRIIPVINESENSFSVLVIDTVQPPVIYIPPPYEPYIVNINTPGRPEEKEHFVFEGVPSFHVSVDEFPIGGHSYISHVISANLGTIRKNKNVLFSYFSSQDSVIDFRTLTIEHDLTKNTFIAKIEPSMDSLIQELNPSDWLPQLGIYPKYLFEGFLESMRLDTAGERVSLYTRPETHPPKNYSNISIMTPLNNNRHNISINLRDIELWNINGNINSDSSGHKYISTSIVFSGHFEPISISAEIYTDIDDPKRYSESKPVSFEFESTDSMNTDSLRRNN